MIVILAAIVLVYVVAQILVVALCVAAREEVNR